ncbi:MAG: hypothetical protein Q8R55_00780, partial [Candidatus Taylorbacteria bacterium]|nr:hypothetical protein [Candidatus Taylorbacteria bacterium]
MVGAMLVPGCLISYFTGHREILWTVGVTTALYFKAYNHVHTCFHVPNGCRWFEKTGLYKRMNRYHKVHHVRNEKWEQLINICLVCPFADWVMKTWFQPAKNNGNPVR